MRSDEELFTVWAPAASRWSAWAKPILFAIAHQTPRTSRPFESFPVEGLTLRRDMAIIVDKPSKDSVQLGVALAQIGYRPVPLYNCTIAPGMLIDMQPVAEGLVRGADVLAQAKISPDAPPVFLLSDERMNNAKGAKIPGRFDNRWCVMPQDMPSASFLRAAGIVQILLIADRVNDDLSHILRRYQDAGMPLRQAPNPGSLSKQLTVERPRFYKAMLYRFGVLLGLRRNSAGGFGAVVPTPSGSGFG